MRKFRYQKSRWDLFFYLHCPSKFRSQVLLEPIPEDICLYCCSKINESKHKCTSEKYICNKQLNNCEAKKRKSRHRKHWQTSPENRKIILDSYSKLQEKEKDSRETLPPINIIPKNNQETNNNFEWSRSKSERMHGRNNRSKLDSNVRSDTSLSEPEWIVRRTERMKPQDHLKLEGSMQLETTFKSTIGSRNEMTQKEQERVDRKSVYRPKTSLKSGGPGYFNTINRESYKNFVVLPNDKYQEKKTETKVKNNIKNNETCQQKNNKIIKNDSMQNENVNKDTGNKIKVNTSSDTSDQSKRYKKQEKKEINGDVNKSKPELNGVKSKSIDPLKPIESIEKCLSKDKKSSENDENKSDKKPDSLTEESNNKLKGLTSDKIIEQNKLSPVRRTPIRPLSSLTVSGKFKQDHKETITGQKRHFPMIASIKGSHGSSSTSDQDNKTQKTIEKRGHSLPRRLGNLKNESQLKFDGPLDFATTTRQTYKDVPRAIFETRTKKRDLFKESSESDFERPAFDESTTYNSQFKNKLYCPAIDLGSRKSDFQYKGEAGGHHFYLPITQF